MKKSTSTYAEKFNRKLLKQVKVTRNNPKRNPTNIPKGRINRGK